ncbi:MAG: hypothetical protein QM778_30520 [Myxococcales bacterium]
MSSQPKPTSRWRCFAVCALFIATTTSMMVMAARSYVRQQQSPTDNETTAQPAATSRLNNALHDLLGH